METGSSGSSSVFASLLATSTGARLTRRTHERIQERFAASYAQLPVKWALGFQRDTDYISDISFDSSGELLVRASTDGRVTVQQVQHLYELRDQGRTNCGRRGRRGRGDHAR